MFNYCYTFFIIVTVVLSSVNYTDKNRQLEAKGLIVKTKMATFSCSKHFPVQYYC